MPAMPSAVKKQMYAPSKKKIRAGPQQPVVFQPRHRHGKPPEQKQQQREDGEQRQRRHRPVGRDRRRSPWKSSATASTRRRPPAAAAARQNRAQKISQTVRAPVAPGKPPNPSPRTTPSRPCVRGVHPARASPAVHFPPAASGTSWRRRPARRGRETRQPPARQASGRNSVTPSAATNTADRRDQIDQTVFVAALRSIPI